MKVDLTTFVLEHYPIAREWPEVQLANWLNWAAHQGFLFGAVDGERTVGLAIVRPVFHPHLCCDTLEFDPEGDTYFVDLAITLPPKRQAMQALGFGMLKRFGMRDKIAFQRRGGPVIVVDAHEHRRRLLRTTKEVQHHG